MTETVRTTIFISHATADDESVTKLHDSLEAATGFECWLDHKDIIPPMEWREEITNALAACSGMIVAVSRNSTGRTEVEAEWDDALTQGKPLFVVIIDNIPHKEINYRLRKIQYVNLHADWDAGLERLIAATKSTFSDGAATNNAVAPTSSLPNIMVVDMLPAPWIEWIKVPAGKVKLIPDNTSKKQSYLKHDTIFDVPEFFIAKYPITNAQYAKFVDVGGYRNRQWWTAAGWEALKQGWVWNSDKEKFEATDNAWTEPRYWQDNRFNCAEQPVVGVSWHEAIAFCQWLSEISGEKVMLPTEQQWQRAAQGDDGRTYPWGNNWDGTCCNNSVNSQKSDRTTPVQQYEGRGDSPFGVVDMVGNVWEWCLTAYGDSNEDINSTSMRVLRGGSWIYINKGLFCVSFRNDWNPLNWYNYGGFRCCGGQKANLR